MREGKNTKEKLELWSLEKDLWKIRRHRRKSSIKKAQERMWEMRKLWLLQQKTEN